MTAKEDTFLEASFTRFRLLFESALCQAGGRVRRSADCSGQEAGGPELRGGHFPVVSIWCLGLGFAVVRTQAQAQAQAQAQTLTASASIVLGLKVPLPDLHPWSTPHTPGLGRLLEEGGYELPPRSKWSAAAVRPWRRACPAFPQNSVALGLSLPCNRVKTAATGVEKVS